MPNHYFHYTSALMVFIGLCVMIISIITSLKINKIVKPQFRHKWTLITALMVAFLVGYGAFLFLQFHNLEKYLELITGATFLGGALFVFVVMSLIQNTLTFTNNVSKSLEEKIKEQEMTAKALQHSKASLESVFNSAIPLCITNKDKKIIQANDAYNKLFGDPTQHSDMQNCFESRPSSECHSENCPLTRVIAGEVEVVLDMKKKDISGQEKIFIVTARPFRDANNKTIGIVQSFQDISQRKFAEEVKGELIEELQNTLNEVNLLSGFLPICAACKKIRDDKGYWNQIETYIRDHSQAEFSHSICPECAESLYPEAYNNLKKNGK